MASADVTRLAGELDYALRAHLENVHQVAATLAEARRRREAAAADPPAAPVQPEERSDFVRLLPNEWFEEQIELLTVGAGERDLRWSNYRVVAAVLDEIDRLRAALATAEREREEAREQWRIEVGLRQALGANYRSTNGG